MRKCRYCDFYSRGNRFGEIDRWISLLENECTLELEELGHDRPPVRTVYFGGGTPSLLSTEQYRRLAEIVTARFDTSGLEEWTLECNPESFTKDKASAWLESGVNRLSFGIQSLEPSELSILGRSHSREDALRVLSNPILTRFHSVGGDIMYGLPGQSPSSADRTVREMVESGPITHVSAYELTISKNTTFGRHARLLPLPSDELVSDIADRIQLRLEEYGFIRYEVSNYAKPGFESRHNSGYWHHRPYLGIGPSAHSWIPPVRRAKISEISRYMEFLSRGELPLEFSERLDARDLAREMIFLGLRTAEGVNEEELYRRTGYRLRRDENEEVVDEFMRNGLLIHDPPFMRPSREGMSYADGMAVDCAP